MSTSDQQGPLTRKQLREMRLEGSAPAAPTPKAQKTLKKGKKAQAQAQAEAAQAEAEAQALAEAQAQAASPAVVAPVPSSANVDPHAVPLTRRQAREQERIRTASVPVLGAAEPVTAAPAGEASIAAEVVVEDTVVEETPVAEETPVVEEEIAVEGEAVPASPSEEPGSRDEDDDAVDDEIASEPVSAASAVQAGEDLPWEGTAGQGPAADSDDKAADDEAVEDDALAGTAGTDDAEPAEERPTVNPAFGSGVLGEATAIPTVPAASFDQLLSSSDSTGSPHIAPSALIFTQSPTEGSLSGPVASTGEVLVTGSYELPQGIGSRGHAHGTTDGKEVDAVLIDGELPPASSPTPIAASAAVSTIKPAGEVIRPPAPEKGNKLMLTLAIVAGGLALALGAVLIIAFTTNVF